MICLSGQLGRVHDVQHLLISTWQIKLKQDYTPNDDKLGEPVRTLSAEEYQHASYRCRTCTPKVSFQPHLGSCNRAGVRAINKSRFAASAVPGPKRGSI